MKNIWIWTFVVSLPQMFIVNRTQRRFQSIAIVCYSADDDDDDDLVFYRSFNPQPHH